MKILIAGNKRQSGASIIKENKEMRFEAHKSYVETFIREKVKTIYFKMPS